MIFEKNSFFFEIGNNGKFVEDCAQKCIDFFIKSFLSYKNPLLKNCRAKKSQCYPAACCSITANKSPEIFIPPHFLICLLKVASSDKKNATRLTKNTSNISECIRIIIWKIRLLQSRFCETTSFSVRFFKSSTSTVYMYRCFNSSKTKTLQVTCRLITNIGQNSSNFFVYLVEAKYKRKLGTLQNLTVLIVDLGCSFCQIFGSYCKFLLELLTRGAITLRYFR